MTALFYKELAKRREKRKQMVLLDTDHIQHNIYHIKPLCYQTVNTVIAQCVNGGPRGQRTDKHKHQ